MNQRTTGKQCLRVKMSLLVSAVLWAVTIARQDRSIDLGNGIVIVPVASGLEIERIVIEECRGADSRIGRATKYSAGGLVVSMSRQRLLDQARHQQGHLSA